MSSLAFVFPGQGAQQAGMGRALAEAFSEARLAFAEADAALGFALSRLCFEGPDTDLALTENTQPAILATSVAALRVLAARGVRPALVAGHSLGEYSALVAAGALDFGDALRVVRSRGRFMQEAVPVGEGAMAAILGLEAAVVSEICSEAARGEVVTCANFNEPAQTVIAGHANAVKRAVALAEARGAKRAIMLQVSAPFHSPLMAPARARLEPELAKLDFAPLRIPLVTNVNAAPVRSAAAARDALVRQVDSPVRWVECVQRLAAEGAGTVVEVGPGRVLSGLARRIDKTLALYNVEDPASLDKTLAGLGVGS